ncbi:MAG: DNA gyrase subunit A [Erysipelotrichaceae bacterium]|jgi:DNA gyrase subunit A|nr:DNA gyrase subunit A [Erysipelotrichaceae bacterium]
MSDEEKKTNIEETIEEIEEGIVPGLQDTEIVKQVQNSFLDYAMSVIVSRAIPDARDGLKPVHRRIIYGMNEAGMQPDKPYKKCARIVGDVMGKYHPHGDSAIYQTLVRLAQPFSIRCTLVDGHGNFGSIDGDEAAAMRYTEARMTKLALEMVRDINYDTVDFVDNYDGTEREPVVLPSRFPNLLVNGSNGIAVGMATNIPTHNLGEVIDGVIALARNPEITPEEIEENYIHGPDFPTGGIILGRRGIREAYTSGTGSIVIRSKAEIEEMEHGKSRIIVREIPYQVNKANMIEKMAGLVRDKVIDGITDIRDESNKDGIRVVIELRRDVVPEVILNQLYKNTQLQTSYGIINLCLVDGAPKILPITEMLRAYLNFQVEVIERRTRFLLKKDEDRLHIVEGLLICHDNIDEVVEIIKASATPEAAINSLMERFNLSEPQVQAIMAMSLRRLTGIETQKLEAEKVQLQTSIKNGQYILEDRSHVIDVIVKELEEIKHKFNDDRRTEISDELATIDDEDLIPVKDIVITLTKSGYVKRLASDTFRTQNRGGRGVRGMSTNENDVVDIMLYTKTHTDLLFFTDFGKVYRIRGYQVPESGRNSKGIPVVNLLNIDQDEHVKAIIPVDQYEENHFLFFTTTGGVVKRTEIKEFESIRQNGKIAISLREGDMLLDVKCTDGDTIVGIASNNGKMVKFNENEVRPMGRTAAGVKGMNVSDGSKVIGVTTSLEGKYILAITDKGYGKMSLFEEYRLTSRGTKGVLTIKENEKIGTLISVRAVEGNEDLLVITLGGIVIRTPLEQVKIAGRNTQGVRIIRLEGKQKVSSIAIVDHIDEEVENEQEEAGEVTVDDSPIDLTHESDETVEE